MTGHPDEFVRLRAENARLVEEDLQEPWKRSTVPRQRLPGPMPTSLKLTVANLIYIGKDTLPPALANRLIRLAAFARPSPPPR